MKKPIIHKGTLIQHNLNMFPSYKKIRDYSDKPLIIAITNTDIISKLKAIILR